MRHQWKPIETAPKDGTYIELCDAVNADGEPIGPEAFGLFVQVAAWWGDGEGWVVYCSMVQEPRLHFEPTHWRELPDNPLLSPAVARANSFTDLRDTGGPNVEAVIDRVRELLAIDKERIDHANPDDRGYTPSAFRDAMRDLYAAMGYEAPTGVPVEEMTHYGVYKLLSEIAADGLGAAIRHVLKERLLQIGVKLAEPGMEPAGRAEYNRAVTAKAVAETNGQHWRDNLQKAHTENSNLRREKRELVERCNQLQMELDKLKN